ncbi:MAG: hypothetical protein H6Q67_2242 [Firmicutes bacterium]|nr:hypothetical protein [Bacillota bacterium]
MKKLIAAYCRVSKEEQAEKDLSLPAQKDRIVSYCHSQDWQIFDYYIDDGYSAKNLNRPEMKRMIKDCAAGKINAVVVVRLDRISRSQKDVLYLIEDVFERNDVGFKSVTQSFDTTTAFGKAAIGMLAVFAQLERDQLIERVLDAKKEAAKQGRYGGGPTPYGYFYNSTTKVMEVNELEAKTVRFIYEEYLKGDIGYQEITDLLNKKKTPAPKAAEWNRVAVRYILTSPTYTGKIIHRGTLHEGKHQPLVTEEEWIQVQQILKSRNKYLPRTNSGMVSGIIYCGECGARMRTKNVWQNYPQTNPKKVTTYYVCYSQGGSSDYMVKDPNCKCGYKQVTDIDQRVVGQLMQYSLTPRLIKEELSNITAKAQNQSNAKALAHAKKELVQVKKHLDKWYSAFEKGALDPDELTDRVKELREQRAYLEQQIDIYEAEELKKQDKDEYLEQFSAILKNFKKAWRTETPEGRKVILQNLVKKVYVYRDNRVSIEFFEE